METKTLISLVFVLQAIINGVNLIIAQKPGLSDHQLFMCTKNGNFKSDALIKDREDALNTLLAKIKNSKGIYSGTEMGNSDGVWSIGVCPPNVKLEACADCVSNTIPFLKNSCPKQKEGVAWTALPRVLCIVRYADHPVSGNLGDWAWADFGSPANMSASTAAELEKELNNLANTLKEMVRRTNLQKRYGSGSVSFGPGRSRTLYGSMQCNVGISEDNCMKCLSDVTSKIHKCCSKERRVSGVSMSANCYYWYNHVNFLPASTSLLASGNNT